MEGAEAVPAHRQAADLTLARRRQKGRRHERARPGVGRRFRRPRARHDPVRTPGRAAEVTIIDKSDAFVLGYSKLDVMFGGATLDARSPPYNSFVKPGVRFLRETVTSIDPATRRVTTDVGIHDCDYLVVALGADYDLAATPGLEGADEFYSVAGAHRLRDDSADVLQGPSARRRMRGAVQMPAGPQRMRPHPARLADEEGRAGQCEIAMVLPLPSPVPPSPDTSKALIAAFGDATSRSCPTAGSRRSIPVAASPSSTTATEFPTISSSACRSTARRPWSRRAE